MMFSPTHFVTLKSMLPPSKEALNVDNGEVASATVHDSHSIWV
jgi:hypothetical protein